ncbi:MAG: IS200/IS605 family transposase [Bacteroidota bacterium]
MSFVKIMIHCVWSTKNREPLLTKEKRIEIIKQIEEGTREKNIFIECMNGYTDHLHALVSLGKKQNIADIMQQIKGRSSFWINNNAKFFPNKFEWADKYYAVSVSESQLNKVRNYINNQEEHHRKITFTQECDEFIGKYGFGELG